jgi:hypothetical protein
MGARLDGSPAARVQAGFPQTCSPNATWENERIECGLPCPEGIYNLTCRCGGTKCA